MHYSALRTGISYLPFSGGIVISAGIGTQLLPRVGPRVLMTLGGLLSTGAMVWLTQLNLTSSYAGMILPAFIVMSIGMGFVFVPLSNVSLSGVTDHDAGVASAMVNTTQQVGGSLGTALLNTIFVNTQTDYVKSHGLASFAQAAIHGYNAAFTVSAVLLGLSALVVFVMIRKVAPVKQAPGGELDADADQLLVPVHLG
jgi:hypothetical protein